MQAVLAMFRGETSLAEAPEQVFDPTTPPVSRTARRRHRTTAPATDRRRRPTTAGTAGDRRAPQENVVRHRPAARRDLLRSVQARHRGSGRRRRRSGR